MFLNQLGFSLLFEVQIYIPCLFSLPHSGSHILENNLLIIQVVLIVSKSDSHFQVKRKHCHLNVCIVFERVSLL